MPEYPAALARLAGRYSIENLTARRALRMIVIITTIVSIASAVLIWLVDRTAYPTIGAGLWWALQTVTTVGYGDHLPSNGAGRAVAVVVMLTGIAFLTVATATITAAFLENARRRLEPQPDSSLAKELRLVRQEVEALRTELHRRDA